MFDIFGGYKRYHYDEEGEETPEYKKDIMAVKYWIAVYAIILVVWHGFFSLLLEDFEITRILLIYIINTMFWYWMGFMFATDNDRGHNLFILACAFIWGIIMLVRVVFQIGNYWDDLTESLWVIFVYIIAAKIGTKFAGQKKEKKLY